MKTRSASVIIREAQSKAQWGMTHACQNGCDQNTANNVGWGGCGGGDCWWECKLVQPLKKTVWMLLKRLKVGLPYDPAIPFLDFFSKENKQKILFEKIHEPTPVFTAAFFIVAEIRKQSVSLNRWMDKKDVVCKHIWYMYIYMWCVYIYVCVCVCGVYVYRHHTHTSNGILI